MDAALDAAMEAVVEPWLGFVADSRPRRMVLRAAMRALDAGKVEPLTPALAHQLGASGRWPREVIEHLVEHDALYAPRADAVPVQVPGVAECAVVSGGWVDA